jgi:hypothetical protein
MMFCRSNYLAIALFTFAVVFHGRSANCQDVVSAPQASGASEAESANEEAALEDSLLGEPPDSNRWLILMCGLPGDDLHRERLTAAVKQIVNAAEPVLSIEPTRVAVLVGDEQMAADVTDVLSDVDVCTRQSVTTTLKRLGDQIGPADSCWVILLGHAQLYAARSTFNIQGPDFDASELAGWMQPIQCRERVFLLTMPVSGFWLKPLAGKDTVLISATDADLEFTATEMPYALADILSGQAQNQPLEDIDGDGQISLLDLYLATNLEIHARFQNEDYLQTEHAQLDDNGDGSGTEVQAPYLPVKPAEGEVREEKPPTPRLPTQNRDGDYSRSILINLPPQAAAEIQPFEE